MANLTRPIPELVEERNALSAQLAEINRKLEKLDSELFSRLETALNAFGMWGPTPAVELRPHPQPLAPSVIKPAFPAPPMPTPAQAAPPSATQAALARLELSSHAERPTAPRHGEVGLVIQSRAARMIKEAQKPLKTRELLSRLQQEGVVIPGKDPMNNLSAHLSRSPAFINTRYGWRVKEEQKPPGGGL